MVSLHQLQNYVILRKKDFYAKFIYLNTIEPGAEQYFIEETIAYFKLLLKEKDSRCSSSSSSKGGS